MRLNKRGFIHHPVTWGVVAFILGLIVAYLIGHGTIPFDYIDFCS